VVGGGGVGHVRPPGLIDPGEGTDDICELYCSTSFFLLPNKALLPITWVSRPKLNHDTLSCVDRLPRWVQENFLDETSDFKGWSTYLRHNTHTPPGRQ
jgi:hypothetical protein